MKPSIPRNRKVVLALLGLIVLVGGAGVVAVNSSTEAESSISPITGPPTRPLLVSVPDQVETFRPALKATVAEGVSDELIQQVASVAGVGATARVLLANVVVEVPGGDAQVTIAAVDPTEFRPLAPESTAQAKFVWEGLHRFETLIAHEQYQIFGGQPLQTLAAKGPTGRSVLRIGGLATNGVPNLAGTLMSLNQAAELGLTNPTMLLVGLTQDARSADVMRNLSQALPGVTFERTQATTGSQAFISGAPAQRAIGSFTYVANDDGTVSQDPKWVAQHIASSNVPILGRVRCHRAMLPQLEAALTEIRDAGLSASIKPGQYGGCYVPRFIERDGSKPLSMHAWGLAVDINVADNPVGARPNMDPQVVAIFEKWGFRWGGRWARPDGHHFELAALIQS